VAMSGGVDSSVAAYLLRERGYRPVGVFLCAGLAESDPAASPPRGPVRCCAGDASAVAREAARRLGISFAVLDFSEDFDRLIDYACAEYGRGRTPNPCVLCNRDLKFGRLRRYAEAMGARLVATGHYARIREEAGRWHLERARDRRKDQSYFLFALAPGDLPTTLFPVGDLAKTEVRALARRLDLPTHDRPESQDICFAAGPLGDLVRRRRPDLIRPGPILDMEGREVGRHRGIVDFTIGQRRGLGVAMGRPMYVVEVRPADAAIVIGPAEVARRARLVVEEVVWHEPPSRSAPDGPPMPLRAEVQIRHRHRPAPAWITPLEDPDGRASPSAPRGPPLPPSVAGGGASPPPRRVEVRFDEPQSAPTPGQAAVFYRGDRLLGGGWIAEVGP